MVVHGPLRTEISYFRSIFKEINKTEVKFHSCLKTAEYLCGDFVRDGDEMTLYVDEVLPQIRTVVHLN